MHTLTTTWVQFRRSGSTSADNANMGTQVQISNSLVCVDKHKDGSAWQLVLQNRRQG